MAVSRLGWLGDRSPDLAPSHPTCCQCRAPGLDAAGGSRARWTVHVDRWPHHNKRATPLWVAVAPTQDLEQGTACEDSPDGRFRICDFPQRIGPLAVPGTECAGYRCTGSVVIPPNAE